MSITTANRQVVVAAAAIAHRGVIADHARIVLRAPVAATVLAEAAIAIADRAVAVIVHAVVIATVGRVRPGPAAEQAVRPEVVVVAVVVRARGHAAAVRAATGIVRIKKATHPAWLYFSVSLQPVMAWRRPGE